MSSSTAAMYVFSQVALAIAICHRIRKKSEPRKKGRPAARVRQRRSVQDVYECLGPTYFRRAYRMSYESFWILHDKLRDGIEEALKEKQTNVPDEGGKLHNRAPPIPNGSICTSVRLACAIRYFAGGSPYDISVMYGMSYSTTMSCVWAVVDAINHHKEFFEYPESHDEQRSIAEGFKKASTPEIDICAGAVDGILIWTNKPTVDECNFLGVGQKKFLCGRKHKFGLNCQAVSDARGRFLDISIVYGGATSDCLAFERSKLFGKLSDGMLAEGLCLFRDNAYLNSPFLATPYQNVGPGTKDDYNFYHSQVRIRIECAFGIFTERWAILRSAIPKQIAITKTIALVHALAKLHNFCIDVQETQPGEMLPQDVDHMTRNLTGSVPLEADEIEDTPRPIQLIGGGHHFDDVPRDIRRRRQLTPCQPRELLHERISNEH